MTVAELQAELAECSPDAEVTAGIIGASGIELRAGGELLGYLDA